MKTVGIFEAKTKLSEICSIVSETGEKIVITRRGVPVVELSPFKSSEKSIIEEMEEFKAKWPRGSNEPDFILPKREPFPDVNIFQEEE